MSDKPILFSAPMVRALLAGTKTQTRRAIPERTLDAYYDYDDWCSNVSAGVPTSRQFEHEFFLERSRIAVGDRLYVREHWRTSGSLDSIAPRDLPRTAAVLYNADPGRPVWAGKHRQAMHMPRWASRLTLTVTDVRVQRLHQIDGADARAEGTPCYVCGNPLDGKSEADCHCFHRTADASDYANLWNAINGTKEQPDPWSLNPWVAAYTFTVERCNIDQARAAA